MGDVLTHKKLTADGKLALGGGDSADRACKVWALQLVAAAEAATVVCYKDGAATAGKEFCKLSAATNTEKEWQLGPVMSAHGFYFDIEGTNAVLHVFYD